MVEPAPLLQAHALPAVAALVAGALNAVAGGGSFFTFPALLAAGIPPIPANATSTVALWPGSLASAFAYRKDLRTPRRELLAFSATSLVGGTLGALLLVKTPERLFNWLLPVLLLIATLAFTFGERLSRPEGARATTRTGLLRSTALQLGIAVYGGYFGGGIGLLMLAAFLLSGMSDLHAMNGLKSLLAALMNGAALVAFIVSGTVVWDAALVMASAAIAGGYGGASLARRLDRRHVRLFVVGVGWVLTAAFALRAARL